VLAAKIDEPQATYVADFAAAAAAVVVAAGEGDLILTLGAGSVSQLATQILSALEKAKS
jgi:UDP-N-acetylmuramate--alanine ligase